MGQVFVCTARWSFFGRYVDDICLVVKKNIDLNDLLIAFNNADPEGRIKFTMELETNGSLPFLDTLLDHNHNSLSISVYRKPTHSNRFVHFSSCQPTAQKLGIVRTLSRRAVQLSSNSAICQVENDLLFDAFEKCAYPKNDVKRFMIAIGASRQPEDPSKPKCIVPFLPGLSNPLTKFLKRWNITVVSKKQNTLGHLLYKRSPDCEFFDQQNVIYRVNCSGCQKCYVGQTRRKVRCRLKDHKNAIKWNKEENAIALHVKNCGHRVDPFNADIIARDNRSDFLTAKESLLIDSTDCINLVTGCANKDLAHLLSHYSK